MALLRRLLALSCDRHMRNATAVSALAYAVVVLLAARRRCCAVCWPSHAIGTCEMPRLQLLVSRAKGCVVGLMAASNRLQAVCWVQ